MRAAIGNSLLFNIVIIFTTVVILFFVGTLAYSRAYKVKNRIISIIEKYEDFNLDSLDEINTDLANVGYGVGTVNCTKTSYYLNKQNAAVKPIPITSVNGVNLGYDYCVYLYNLSSDDGESSEKYYEVVTFTQFNIPVIGEFLRIPVSGETKILGRDYDY